MAVTADHPAPRGAGDSPVGLDAEALARALTYPYDRPGGSFLYDAARHRVTPLATRDVAGWASGRQAVLAVGSNAAPEQLRRKFGSFAGERRIPALAATVRDHDVVFAARVSAYGAVPATLAPCPGAIASVTVLLLAPDQVVRMGETESLGRAYDLVPVDAALLAHEGRPHDTSGLPPAVACYAARCGPLRVAGAPVALAAVRVTGRIWPEMTEHDLLGRLARRAGLAVEAFAHRLVTDVPFRRRVAGGLAGGLPDL